MNYFLAIQNTYTHVQIGLYQNLNCIQKVEIDKTNASKETLVKIQLLLQRSSLALSDLSFIAVNQGPGPFTTLRVVISTVNGISFASKIPLIGVNGIEAFLSDEAYRAYENRVVLLNAFGRDLYFGIHGAKGYYHEGCGPVAYVLDEILKKLSYEPILFLGNGIDQSLHDITQKFGQRALFLPYPADSVSLEQIAKQGLHRWNAQEAFSYQLQPLYFKPAFFHH